MEQTEQTAPAEFVKVNARDDRKAYNRQYYLQHREEIKARARQRYEAHKEVEREKARMRYRLKRDRAAAAAVAIASS